MIGDQWNSPGMVKEFTAEARRSRRDAEKRLLRPGWVWLLGDFEPRITRMARMNSRMWMERNWGRDGSDGWDPESGMGGCFVRRRR